MSEGRRDRDDERPLLPDISQDERAVGWGADRPDDEERRDAEWYRRERPPHHE